MDNNIGVSIYFTKRNDNYFQEEGRHCGWEGGGGAGLQKGSTLHKV